MANIQTSFRNQITFELPEEAALALKITSQLSVEMRLAAAIKLYELGNYLQVRRLILLVYQKSYF